MSKISKQVIYFERICKEIDIYTDKVKNSNSEEQAKIKILKPKIQSYENIIAQAFDKLSPKENNDNLDTYLKYQEVVCDLLIDLEAKSKTDSPHEIRVESQSKQTSLVKLPKFDLPHFYGDSETWISFKELFKSSILENKSLSNIEKQQYLFSAVRGNAAKLIRGFSLKEENLYQCWDILCERFENKRQLALSQINKIFSVKIVKANNSKSLLELLDTCNEAVRNLETLGLESNSLSDLMLINFMLTKLDQPLKQRWELFLENDKIPDLELFRNFIEREARSVEETKYNKEQSKFSFQKKPLDSNRVKTNVMNSAILKNDNNCLVCNLNHALFKCPVFNSKPVRERWEIVKVNKLCQNCLRQNHKLEQCRININCKNCSHNHHTLLHRYTTQQTNNNPEISLSNSAHCHTTSQNYNVLLSTARVNIISSTGNVIQCRALIDNASQNSLISKGCVERLNLPLFNTRHKLIGINGVTAETCLNSTEFKISPYFSNNCISIKALVVNKVTTPLPNFRLMKQTWPHTRNLQLADPSFFKTSSIDLLLGADIFATMLTGSPILGKTGEPIAIPTHLGYLLSGCVSNPNNSTYSVACHTVSLTEFFDLESVPPSHEPQNSDPVENLYQNSTFRNSEGRYVVQLPLQENAELGDSASQALRVFYSLENKFAKNPDLKSKYVAFMEEYLKLGHMEILKAEDEIIQPNFYLPHHAVINNNSTTTKLRVVFNASAKSTNGHSLNSILLKGPKMQTSIFSHLVKFDLQNLFQSGGFSLRKWASNDPRAIETLPESFKASNSFHSLNPDSSQRILGLEWNLETDSLRVQVVKEKPVTTKRQLLSIIARVFDPLGLLSPCTIILKILMQEVWKANLNWDDQLPLSIAERWNKFHDEIHNFKFMQIPRFMSITSTDNFEIHGFCDASIHAYAAVVYIKSFSNHVRVSLIASKTRVAPTTPVTLPRLELCSALLLSELIHAIQYSLPDSNHRTFLWTDSTIALSWIVNPPAKGNQFVLHRVTKIRKFTSPQIWHHIPGRLNPADCATRGLYPHQLKGCQSWWSGPTWLYESVNPFLCPTSSNPIIAPVDSVPKSTCLLTQVDHDFDIIHKVSSYTKLIRIVAWIYRFINNTRSSLKIKDCLTVRELSNACKTVVKLVQKSAFSSEINFLKQNKPLPQSSKLIPLNAFLDPDEILRVGGRLRKNQILSFDSKYPMLIPKSHPLAASIIRYYHASSLHAGPNQVLSLLRQKFWIPDGRSTTKKELKKCIRCSRISARPITQIMGDLPPARVNPCRVFQQIGIDFAGPINTKCQHARKSTVFKSYICLFICMCTKAVHLELVSNLTTDSFLFTLRRFIARRGYPSDIFSDNGRTFIGAASYLKELFTVLKHSKIQEFCAHNQISWHFMPPYGPNFGGLWESSIKLAKRHLKKSCQGALMTFEELTTTLCLIESCINSRPLSPLSTDPNDITVLTPGHFIIGEPLLSLPDCPHTSNPSLSLSSRWNLCIKLRDHFWQRWTKEYLQTLNLRSKWQKGNHLIKIGQVVLVKDPAIQPNQWRLALIEDIHPGPDNIVRVVTIRTKDGTFKRPIQQLSTLPDVTLGPPEVMEKKASVQLSS